MTTIRLQKILARGGLASRRHAEELIVAGRVRINGKVVKELGTKADPRKDRIEVDGQRVTAESFVYVVMHKPRGVVSTMSDPEGRPTVRDVLQGPERRRREKGGTARQGVAGRVFPVGRLDFATSGVLLATNDGAFSDGLLHPKKAVPKTYIVKVTGEMKPADLERWRKGIQLEDGMTAPADLKLARYEAGKTWFELTIREGRNQQIRRMGEATGFPVMRLSRTVFAGITGEGLRPGEWRSLTHDEILSLRKEYGVPKRMPSLDASAPTGRPNARPRRVVGTGPAERGAREARGPAREPRARGESDRQGRSSGPARRTGRSEAARESSGPARRTGRSEAVRESGGPARRTGRSEAARESGGLVREPRAERGRGTRPAQPAREPRAERDRGARPAQPARAPRAERPTREPKPRADAPRPRRQGSASGDTPGPRYGGGSPGRRSYDVTEDWGGGAGRGRSSGRFGGEIPPDRPSRGGASTRSGASRTTGSGGGIGGDEGGDYRISRTRRR